MKNRRTSPKQKKNVFWWCFWIFCLTSRKNPIWKVKKEHHLFTHHGTIHEWRIKFIPRSSKASKLSIHKDNQIHSKHLHYLNFLKNDSLQAAAYDKLREWIEPKAIIKSWTTHIHFLLVKIIYTRHTVSNTSNNNEVHQRHYPSISFSCQDDKRLRNPGSRPKAWWA